MAAEESERKELQLVEKWSWRFAGEVTRGAWEMEAAGEDELAREMAV